MNLKKYFLVLILLSIISGCSKEADELIDNNSNPNLNLILINSNQYSGKFDYDYSPNIEDVKLIWNITNEVDLSNKIGEKNLTGNSSNVTVSNLKQDQIYFFRLVGKSNNQLFYSEIISLTTPEIDITFNNQILLDGDPNNGPPDHITKLDDGYLIIGFHKIPLCDDISIKVYKIDKQFNLLWSFTIDEGNRTGFVGLYELENKEFIAFARKFSHTNEGLYNNQFYAFKFNDSGDIIWIKDYSKKAVELDTHRETTIKFSGNSKDIKVLVNSDSTYYVEGDSYYRELHLDPDGEILSNNIIGNYADYEFNTIAYDKAGNKYNYGMIDIVPNDVVGTYNGMLQKYDINNNLVLNYNYGNYGAEDQINNIIIEEDRKVAMIGTNGHQGAFDGESRWILKINEENGEIIWSIKETRVNFLYQAKDLIKDQDDNYLSLFFDIYYPGGHVYNLATLIKSDNEGNIIWKFVDGEDFNSDQFTPEKVFYENGEYLIFGSVSGSDGSPLWLKRIKVD